MSSFTDNTHYNVQIETENSLQTLVNHLTRNTPAIFCVYTGGLFVSGNIQASAPTNRTAPWRSTHVCNEVIEQRLTTHV